MEGTASNESQIVFTWNYCDISNGLKSVLIEQDKVSGGPASHESEQELITYITAEYESNSISLYIIKEIDFGELALDASSSTIKVVNLPANKSGFTVSSAIDLELYNLWDKELGSCSVKWICHSIQYSPIPSLSNEEQ